MNDIASRVKAVVALSLALLAGVACAEATVCPSHVTTIGFFNGVATTRAQAHRIVTRYLPALYGATDKSGNAVRYQLFYNHTAGLSRDVIETFEEKIREQDPALADRIEFYWEALRGGGLLFSKLSALEPTYATFLDTYSRENAALIAASISKTLETPSLLDSDYADHKTQLDSLDITGNRIVLLGHSQGNLFVDKAYESLRKTRLATSFKAVHVAQVSTATNGAATIASQDLVVIALRAITSGLPPADEDTPIPLYPERPPGLDGQTDLLGHGLLEIYLNLRLPISDKVNGDVRAAIDAVTDPACAVVAPTPSRAFDTYLPAAFAGFVAPTNACGPKKMDGGTVSISDTGSITGSGCFAGFALDTSPTRYSYTQTDRLYCVGGLACQGTLSIGDFARSDVGGQFTATELYGVDRGFTVVSSTPIVGPGVTIASPFPQTLRLDTLARLSGWIGYIQGKPCTMGSATDGPLDTVVELADGTVNFKQNGVIKGSILVAELQGFDYHEQGGSLNFRQVLSRGFKFRTFSLEAAANDPSLARFRVSASVRDESGRETSLGCAAR